jgi:hypothetical protein
MCSTTSADLVFSGREPRSTSRSRSERTVSSPDKVEIAEIKNRPVMAKALRGQADRAPLLEPALRRLDMSQHSIVSHGRTVPRKGFYCGHCAIMVRLLAAGSTACSAGWLT